MDADADVDITNIQFLGRRGVEHDRSVEFDACVHGIVRILKQGHDCIADILVDETVVLADDRARLAVDRINKSKILFSGHHLGVDREGPDIAEEDSEFAAAGVAQRQVGKAVLAQVLAEFLGHELVIELLRAVLLFKRSLEASRHLVDLRTDLAQLVFGLVIDSRRKIAVSDALDGPGRFLDDAQDHEKREHQKKRDDSYRTNSVQSNLVVDVAPVGSEDTVIRFDFEVVVTA